MLLDIDKVLTGYYLFAYAPCRAQKRLAQQRIDSKMDLGRVVDIRKKVFNEVKVRTYHQVILDYEPRVSFVLCVEILEYGVADWRRATDLDSAFRAEQ